MAKTLILSKVDYCDIVFHPPPQYLLKRLQRLQVATVEILSINPFLLLLLLLLLLLPPPGGYVIIWICMCVCVCVCACVCVYVCLSVSTITQEIPNIFIRNFWNAFPIG